MEMLAHVNIVEGCCVLLFTQNKVTTGSITPVIRCEIPPVDTLLYTRVIKPHYHYLLMSLQLVVIHC